MNSALTQDQVPTQIGSGTQSGSSQIASPLHSTAFTLAGPDIAVLTQD